MPEPDKKFPNLRKNLDWLIRKTSLTDVLDELARHVEAEAKAALMAGSNLASLYVAANSHLLDAATHAEALPHQGVLRHPLHATPAAAENGEESPFVAELGTDTEEVS